LLVSWIHELHCSRLHRTSASVNTRKGQIRRASSKVRSKVCESDTVSSPFGHPMHLPCALIFLKSNSGIELSNYLRVPTVPETHQRLDP
jgi:hypothetical protein